MRLSSWSVWGALLVLGACSGEDFTPAPSGATAGSAGDAGAAAAGATSSAGTGGAAGEGGAAAGSGSSAGEGGANAGGNGGDTGVGGAHEGGNAGSSAGTGAAGGSAGTAGNGGAGTAGNGGAGTAGSGGAATAGNGGAGGANLAGAAGLGGAAGASGAGTSCPKIAPCGNDVLEAGEGCDIASCQDAWCSSSCAKTNDATKLSATEICRDGICWMILAKPQNTRTLAAAACAQLAPVDGRAWRLAYWLSPNELQTLLAVAGYRLDSAANNAMWLQPLYTPARKGWYLPNLSGGPAVNRALPNNKDQNMGLRVIATPQGPGLFNTLPDTPTVANQASVLCRPE